MMMILLPGFPRGFDPTPRGFTKSRFHPPAPRGDGEAARIQAGKIQTIPSLGAEDGTKAARGSGR